MKVVVLMDSVKVESIVIKLWMSYINSRIVSRSRQHSIVAEFDHAESPIDTMNGTKRARNDRREYL